MHTKLSSGFDADSWRFLVRSNWIRTLAWSLRAALATVWLQRALDQASHVGGWGSQTTSRAQGRGPRGVVM